ncbi:MAG: HAD family hydrolase [Spirochaetes bacterium]|nr:HAD family hydrolase [Spirochaetota bacterium]
MKKQTILLFDLDDTLIIEEDSATDAMIETAKLLAGYNVNVKDFVRTVKLKAREIWKSLPAYQYCVEIGISSWEGLWANFIGDSANLKKLEGLKNYYRINSWDNALKEFGINTNGLAEKLSDKFNIERRKRHIPYPETFKVLKKLKKEYKMGLITNGAPDLQWEKINGSRIKSYFDLIVISGEINAAKPNKEIFEHAINHFKEDKNKFIMIGNSLISDIGGAIKAGITSIWVNRDNKPNNSEHKPDYEIKNLNQLFDIIKIF